MVRSLAPLLRIIFRVAFICNQYASFLCCLLHSALYLFDFRRRAHCSLVYPRHQLGDLYAMITTISKYVLNQLEQIKRAWTCLSRACEWKSNRNVQLRINTWLLKNQWMNVLDIDSIANPTTRVGTLHISLYQLSSKKYITYTCRSLMLYQCIVFARSLPDHSMHHMSLHESFFLCIIV